jgi:hypothetical protein
VSDLMVDSKVYAKRWQAKIVRPSGRNGARVMEAFAVGEKDGVINCRRMACRGRMQGGETYTVSQAAGGWLSFALNGTGERTDGLFRGVNEGKSERRKDIDDGFWPARSRPWSGWSAYFRGVGTDARGWLR